MRRLFTFGCSFTAYEWPTWADILGREFDYFENWGLEGAGNQHICNSVVEAHKRQKFTQDDTIIIMWSSFLRLDLYIDKQLNLGKYINENNTQVFNPGWFTPGTIDGYPKKIFGEKFCETFMNPRGSYIRDLASMTLVDTFLESIGCKKYYLSMVDVGFPTDIYDMSFFKKMLRGQLVEDYECREVLEFYSSIVSKVKPSVHKVIFDYDWQSRKLLMAPSSKTGIPHRTDSHPVPIEHLEYLQKVLPEVIISDNTVNWTKQVSEEVCNFTFYKNETWNPEMSRPKERL